MRLMALKLNNFQGIKEFELKPGGEDVTVLGANATGKTTLFNAFTWLLFGKDSLGQSNFEIKNLDEQGNPTHGLMHEVEAVLLNGDGSTVALKKVFSEKWVKKRGSAEKEFTGHTIDHFVDGVPTKAGEFSAAIAQLAGNEELFRLLTNPKFFNDGLHWQKRRQVLLDVCGDVSDADVIASDPALAELPGILGNHTLENYRKIILGRRTEVNREISDVPVRISECQKGMVETTNTDPKHAASKLTVLRTDLAAKQQEKARIETGGEIAEKTKALREVESKLIDLGNKERRTLEAEAKTRSEKLSAIRTEISAGEIAINRAAARIEDDAKRIAVMQTQLETWRAEWKTIDARRLEYEPSSTCPTCGQALPEEQVETARRKALEDFNQNKASALAGLSTKGKSSRSEIDTLSANRKLAEEEIKTIESHIARLNEKLADLSGIPVVAEENPERAALLEAKQAIESALARMRDGAQGLTDQVQSEIEVIEAEISAQEALIAQIDQNIKTEARIKQLKAQERKLASEYERIEKELYLTDLFIRAKVSMLTEKINSKFELARFKLFETAINGGIAECCEVTFQGVPYGSLNSAMKINTGLDIINTLSEHHGVMAPIFIDNAESVVDLLKTQSQQIRLVVSGIHKTLTMGE